MPRGVTFFLIALTLLLGGCKTELYRGLSQREANEMVAVLARVGIAAAREDVDGVTFKITVDEKEFPAAVEALKRAGMPRETFRSLGDIFKGDGLIVSPYEQRIRTMFALNQEIARTLTSIDGVANARVHIVLPDVDLRGVPMNRPSASVLIHHRAGVAADELSSRIRIFVANAVQGMNFRDVSVAMFPAGENLPDPALWGTEAPGAAKEGPGARLPEPVLSAETPKSAGAESAFGALPVTLWAIAALMLVAAGASLLRARVARRAA
jgi:type III secretion protein J